MRSDYQLFVQSSSHSILQKKTLVLNYTEFQVEVVMWASLGCEMSEESHVKTD